MAQQGNKPEQTTSTTLADKEDEFLLGKEFSEDLFIASRERCRLSRREKRIARKEHATELGRGEQPEPVTPHALDISGEELQRLQKADESLASIHKAADGECSTAGVGFFRRGGLLYRRWEPPGRKIEELAVEQLVLPQALRSAVLTLAHTIPLAGHLGRDKTAQRVLQR